MTRANRMLAVVLFFITLIVSIGWASGSPLLGGIATGLAAMTALVGIGVPWLGARPVRRMIRRKRGEGADFAEIVIRNGGSELEGLVAEHQGFGLVAPGKPPLHFRWVDFDAPTLERVGGARYAIVLLGQTRLELIVLGPVGLWAASRESAQRVARRVAEAGIAGLSTGPHQESREL